MSDNEIRQILAERKKCERRMKRREKVLEITSGAIAWGSMLTICFILSVIGG